jgi:hypothetical protein
MLCEQVTENEKKYEIESLKRELIAVLSDEELRDCELGNKILKTYRLQEERILVSDLIANV